MFLFVGWFFVDLWVFVDLGDWGLYGVSYKKWAVFAVFGQFLGLVCYYFRIFLSCLGLGVVVGV